MSEKYQFILIFVFMYLDLNLLDLLDFRRFIRAYFIWINMQTISLKTNIGFPSYFKISNSNKKKAIEF